MPDPIFDNPELARTYDIFDGPRDDLRPYLDIAREFEVEKILDVGCGTGCFAHLLYENGFEPTGVEPARASLDIARRKPNGSRICWIDGYLGRDTAKDMDAVFMTANVAHVFVEDRQWIETLENIHASLKAGGYLIFEARDPDKEAWKSWTRSRTLETKDVPQVGRVTAWCDLVEENFPLITFEWTYLFEASGRKISSRSTLVFRSRKQIEDSLKQTGFQVVDVRDAPDRPGLEFVFIAQAV